ncbi:MAG: hypothetical protein WCF85_04275 [Rhodospirillaceae bacterium]
MTPETETEIKASLAGIHKLLEKVIVTQAVHTEQLAAHSVKLDSHTAQLAEVRATQAVHSEQFVEVRGEIKLINAKLDTHAARLDEHSAQFKHIISLLESHSTQIAELKGQQSILLAWLQATDQRFTAIMAPYQQRAAS